eukprot:CAMPEP_0119299476 /NCGR_PEP_ID=MMETSP1333-20130426/1562_1 /TAXON_ID=418940 /ORGANISM="Scyphosphaera apsteinii, Strain RCC1455" /LENGTH=236 /DNA_ID=CAMNT_0007300923 /DNA_START=114 /DNA_END=824 /DNA_ORIENTATION=+
MPACLLRLLGLALLFMLVDQTAAMDISREDCKLEGLAARSFAKMDRNHDDKVMMDEFIYFSQNLKSSAKKPSVKTAKEDFSQMDLHPDGLITTCEFRDVFSRSALSKEPVNAPEPKDLPALSPEGLDAARAMLSKPGGKHRLVEKLFSQLDENGDQIITIDELAHVLSSMPSFNGDNSASTAPAVELFSRMDADTDGWVTLSEFEGNGASIFMKVLQSEIEDLTEFEEAVSEKYVS